MGSLRRTLKEVESSRLLSRKEESMNIIYRVEVDGSWGDRYNFTDGKKALDLAERLREGSKYTRTIRIELEEENPVVEEEEK